MTKKEELLNFLNENLNETKYLLINERVVETDLDPNIAIPGDTGTKLFGVTPETTITIIMENYSDDLIGSVPNDSTVVEIIGWQVVDKDD